VHPVHRFAGAGLAALARIGGRPAWSLSPEEQAETLVELTRLQAGLSELRLRVLADADRNQVGAKEGATSTATHRARITADDVRTFAVPYRGDLPQLEEVLNMPV
jgi:hypothetical protein